jgi:chromosome partitioning protein
MTGKILAITTLKGGSGKSTIAASLAVHWHLNGDRVVVVDADPQRTLARLGARGQGLGGVQIVEDDSEDIPITVKDLARDHDWVVVDTAGFRNRTMIEALAAADFAVLPIKPSPLDFDAAADTVALIFEVNETAERAGQALPFALCLTQTTRDSVVARHMRGELAAAHYPLLDAELVNRVIYGEAALSGATPNLVQPEGIAAREIAAMAEELERIVGNKKKKGK